MKPPRELIGIPDAFSAFLLYNDIKVFFWLEHIRHKVDLFFFSCRSALMAIFNTVPCGGLGNENGGCMEVYPRSTRPGELCQRCVKINQASTPASKADLEAVRHRF
jgi:hypothetical protein